MSEKHFYPVLLIKESSYFLPVGENQEKNNDDVRSELLDIVNIGHEALHTVQIHSLQM